MTKKSQPGSAAPARRRPDGLIPMAAVRRMVRQIAEKFRPDKIILFGSYAHGTPNEHSDIDILVVMPAKNEINQAVRICQAVDYTFPMDLIVSTPEDLHRRLELEDWFLREIMTKGKVLYERNDGRMGSKGGRSGVPHEKWTGS